MDTISAGKENFFTKDREFYRSFFAVLFMVTLQNVVSYSVNMLDNIMLGAYSQTALSGAATVNQIFFLVQQFALSLGDSLVILSSQYWGQRRLSPARRFTGIALKIGFFSSLIFFAVCSVFPRQAVGIFTSDPAIINEGASYLALIRFTFPPFILTTVLIAALRSVETVRISFFVSVVSLVLNGVINYTLIFGRFGFPELGIRGAAVGTVVSRMVEFLIVTGFLLRRDQRLKLFSENFLQSGRKDQQDFVKIAIPTMAANLLWAISVPMQTMILGHLPGGVASDAIAANSVATTFYQYLKVVVIAMTSSSAVMIGKSIGRGNLREVRADARTLAVIDICAGIVLAGILFVLHRPLLQLYSLNETARILANQLMLVMCVVMVGMSFQMPVSAGILRGSGDIKYSLILNLISTWGIVMPLSVLSAFVLRLPVWQVVLVIQSDQIFKCLPVFLRLRSYRWIRVLTRE